MKRPDPVQLPHAITQEVLEALKPFDGELGDARLMARIAKTATAVVQQHDVTKGLVAQAFDDHGTVAVAFYRPEPVKPVHVPSSDPRMQKAKASLAYALWCAQGVELDSLQLEQTVSAILLAYDVE